MSLLSNLVRRVRLRILATRIRLLNISIVIAVTWSSRLLLRSDALGKRYQDLEGTTE